MNGCAHVRRMLTSNQFRRPIALIIPGASSVTPSAVITMNAGGLVSCMRDARLLRTSASAEAVKPANPPPRVPRVPSVAAGARTPWDECPTLLFSHGALSSSFVGSRLDPHRLPLGMTWRSPQFTTHHSLSSFSVALVSRSFCATAAATASKPRSGGQQKEQALVVVESPSKATTIRKYLGPGYSVLASYGHVRDLAPKPGSVQPEEDWAMTWAVPSRAQRCLTAIKSALKGKDVLVLASDPDREGEAIAWHLEETLRESGALGSTKVIRVAFNEITREAVLHALAHPRCVSTPLVEAYLARRALDYVMGYGLSPVLWRKLPGSKSAGRVQSVALRLITDREHAIRTFQQREYWSVDADCRGPRGDAFEAALTHLDGKRLGQFGIITAEEAQRAAGRVEGASLEVAEVKRTKVERSPPAPFTTSTLQQEASAKLNFDSGKTMLLAQRLYEGAEVGAGLITYMRTDAVTLSAHAIADIRTLVGGRYGPQYLPPEARAYKSQAKNAQEAHEAIRPTDMHTLPSQLAGKIDPAALRLYSMIWRRTAACQMANAVYDQLAVDIDSENKDLRLHAVASQVRFPGHLAVHSDKEVGARFASEAVPEEDEVGSDWEAEDRGGGGLEALAVGQPVAVASVSPDQHFTQPPPRFTEGTLVKALEEAGVGRPSTYASTLRTLIERAYVRKEARRLIPEMRGLLVSAFLQHYFPRYVDTAFTAHLEEQLDDITAGSRPYKAVLHSFNTDLQADIQSINEVSRQEVEDALEGRFGDWLFPPPSFPGANPRQCPMCASGHLEFKLSKMGGFLGCSNYPDCSARLPLSFGSPLDMSVAGGGPVRLGADPDSGLEVTLRTGPYGPYLQLGEAQGKVKPKRVPLPKVALGEMDLALALRLLRLPLDLGEHPTLGGPVMLKLGKFGPYVEHANQAASLPKAGDMFAVTLGEAVSLLVTKGKAIARPGRKKSTVSEKGESEQAAKSGKKEGAKKGDMASKVATDRPPAKRGRKKKGDVAPADGASPAKKSRTTKVKEGQIEAEPSAGLHDGSPKQRGRRKEEVAVKGLADSAEAPIPVGKSRTTKAKAAEKAEVVTVTAPAKRGHKKRETTTWEEGGGAPAEGAGPAGKTRSTKVVVPEGDPGSPPQLRYVKDSVGRVRTPEERAADHAAGVFRRWEIQRGLHRTWLQQQGGQAAATLGHERPASDSSSPQNEDSTGDSEGPPRSHRKKAQVGSTRTLHGLQIVADPLGRVRTPEEKAADHAAGVFREWEVKKGLHRKWLQQQEVHSEKRAARTKDGLQIVADPLGRTRTPEERAADHAAGVFRAWEVKKGLHVKWLKQQEGQGGASAAVQKEGRRKGRPPPKVVRPARAEVARGGNLVEPKGTDQQEYAVAAGG